MLWPPGLPWSLADHIMGPQGAELELPELAEDVCTGWRVHCRGKAAHRTCGAGEPPQWVALGNPVMPQAPQQCTAQQGLICLKEKNLPRHELSLFQHLWQYLCLWEKGKPVNITTAAGILARQHTYSIKEGVFQCALFSPTSSTACYPETNFPSQKQKRSTHVKSPGSLERCLCISGLGMNTCKVAHATRVRRQVCCLQRFAIFVFVRSVFACTI